MRTLALTAPETVAPYDIPVPELRADEIMLRNLAGEDSQLRLRILDAVQGTVDLGTDCLPFLSQQQSGPGITPSFAGGDEDVSLAQALLQPFQDAEGVGTPVGNLVVALKHQGMPGPVNYRCRRTWPPAPICDGMKMTTGSFCARTPRNNMSISAIATRIAPAVALRAKPGYDDLRFTPYLAISARFCLCT